MMSPMRFTIKPPLPFELSLVVTSHGWYGLPPFSWDPHAAAFRFSFELEPGLGVTVALAQSGAAIRGRADATAPLTAAHRKRIVATAKHCLRLDEDFAEFYELARGDDRIGWVCERGAGRILRSPSMFDDLLKILSTTNCSWALTKSMVGRLVDTCGAVAPGGKAFPSARALARRRVPFFRNTIRAGYRAEHFARLARATATGALDPDAWPAATDVVALRKDLLALPGIGPYAAAHLLRLSGHYDDPGIDSWVRAKFQRIYGLRRPPVDAKIVARYRRFGRWLGLALWMDMTRDWHCD